MGQKVNPIGMRLGITRDWTSRWYADTKSFPSYILSDWRVREFLRSKLTDASVSRIHIERAARKANITIHTARPGVVIGRKASYIETKDALRYVAGYCIVNDVSERDFQLKRGASQWSKGKGCDTFGPTGPWLVTSDEVKDPQNLDMWLDVNGERRQRGNTRTMIFGCEHLVWYCSQFFVMEPGDIIITGTPPGVALGMKPAPVFLKPGDVVTLGIAKLGEQRQKIVAAK